MAVDHRADAAGLRSGTSDPVMPDPVRQPDDTLEMFLNEAPTSGRASLPTSDAFVLFLSRFRKSWESYLSAFPSPTSREDR